MRHAREDYSAMKASSVSTHEIATGLAWRVQAVQETLKRAQAAGLFWPLPEAMNDRGAQGGALRQPSGKHGYLYLEEPDWASLHRELKRKHVTLLILWDEAIVAEPGRLQLLAVLRAPSILREERRCR